MTFNTPWLNRLLTVALVAGMCACSTSSDAAIMVQNSATIQSTTGGGDATFTIPAFDMSGGNFLAVLYSGERSASGSDATDVDVTFDGIGMTNGTPLDTVENEGAQLASINYLLNPASSIGDVVITLPVAYRGGATVLSLSGVSGVYSAATFGENLGTNTWTETLTATTGGGMILGAAVDNTFGASGNAPTFGDPYIDTETLSLKPDFIPGLSSAGLVQGYGLVNTSGSFNQSFTPGTSGGNSTRNAGAFLVLAPEPTSIALMGLGMVAVAGVRRRK